MAKDITDPVFARIAEWHENVKETMTLQAIGEKMGFPPESARKSAFQFFQSKNPTIASLRRFSAASGIPLAELVTEQKPGKKRGQPK
jgi:hypothetical protein